MDVIEKQLEYLNQTMKDTAADAHSFLLKYHFGGLIAVLTLLNIDLILVKSISFKHNADYWLIMVGIILIITLSYKYFSFVLKHYIKFSQSHRKLKYKYELTLSFALCKGKNSDYQYYLEQSVMEKPTSVLDQIDWCQDQEYSFVYVAKYLLNHHRLRFKQLKNYDRTYLLIAMVIILLTLSIRIIFLLISH